MKKALIIYGSTTGNTENMAATIKKALDKRGLQTEMKNVTDATVEDLAAKHDLLLLGCPAYGDDTVELQDDFAEFYEKMNGIELNGKLFAVFAPGDRSYEHFCGSVDFLETKMKDLGGKMVEDGLKIDGDPSDAFGEIDDWAQSVAANFV